MTEKQLMDMQQLLKFAEIHCKQLSIEEIEDLQRTVNAELYVRRVKDFKNHIGKAMPDMPNSTPEQQAALEAAFEKFYNTDWTISFGDKSVVIHNEATVYNYIHDMLTELIDSCLMC